MLGRCQRVQRSCTFAAQLISERGAKSITAKLPVTLLEAMQRLLCQMQATVYTLPPTGCLLAGR